MGSLLDCQWDMGIHWVLLPNHWKNQWIVKVHRVPFIKKEKQIIYRLWTRVLATPQGIHLKHPGSNFQPNTASVQHSICPEKASVHHMRIYLPINHWNDGTSLFLGKKHVLQLIGWVIHLKHTLTRFRWVYIIFSRFQAEKKTSTWNMYISIHDSSQKNHRLLLTYTSTSHGPVGKHTYSHGPIGKHMSHKKKTYYFPLCWLFNRDPYNGLLWSLYIWVRISSPKNPKQPGFFSLLTYSHAFQTKGLAAFGPGTGLAASTPWLHLSVPYFRSMDFATVTPSFVTSKYLVDLWFFNGWLVGGFNPSEKY